MMNKMNSHIKNKENSTPLIVTAVMITSILVGCEGGLVGTGLGPDTKEYQLKNLPERVSPDLPESVIKSDTTKPTTPNQPDRSKPDQTPATMDTSGQEANLEAWNHINAQVNSVALRRLIVQENNIFVDLVFADIRKSCEQQPVGCSIPAGELQVTITQDVVNRLIRLYTEWADSVSNIYRNELGAGWLLSITDGPDDPLFDPLADPESVLDRVDTTQAITDRFTALLNTEVVFGKTEYSQLGGTPYDHDITTSFKFETVEHNNGLRVRWREDDSVIRYRAETNLEKYNIYAWEETVLPPNVTFELLTSVDNNRIIDYFYENNAPAERVVTGLGVAGLNQDSYFSEPYQNHGYMRVTGNNPSMAGILLDAESVSLGTEPYGPLPGEPIDPDATYEPGPLLLDRYSTQSQLDDRGAYYTYRDSTSYAIENTLRNFSEIRESIDQNGNLLAREHCYVDLESQMSDKAGCADEDFVNDGPEGSSIIDSVHYFKLEDFDSLVSIHDTTRWEVKGLPGDVKSFAVVSSDQTTAIEDRELLCSGFQGVVGDVEVFCMATDQELESTVVTGLIQGVPDTLIPEASLEQIP